MAEQAISIDEALHAYGVVQLLKEEVILMENEAHRYYRLADECLEEKRYFKSNYYRQHLADVKPSFFSSVLLAPLVALSYCLSTTLFK